jgi:nucleoside-diphosphate-sugar epimerase
VRIFVTGATGALGRSAVSALRAMGYEISALARSDVNVATLQDLGVRPVRGQLLDTGSLAAAFSGHDVVCNLATAVPTGVSAARPGGWRRNDTIRRLGSKCVEDAAIAARVSRVIQESMSSLYADGGDEVLTEESPLSVTRLTESAAVAETRAQEFGSNHGTYVILRFGSLIGDDKFTRWRLERVRQGRPIGVGEPHDWMHVVQVEDAGTAVAAAVLLPPGVYNVGAAPIRRRDFVRAFAEVQGVSDPGMMSGLATRLLRPVAEHILRSQRVSSDRLLDAGWKPRYDEFGTSWLAGEPH